MKSKRLVCFLCTLVLAISMCACSDASEQATQTDNETVSADDNEEATMEKQEDSKENESAESENPVDEYFTPSEEIKNATITSGMIQVGNIVMKEGGYTTVGEFITTYGDNLDTSFYEEQVNDYNTWWERDADENFRHVLNLPVKDTDITLNVSYVSPRTITPDKKTIWDSVIVDVYATSESGKPCMFYPGGVSFKEFSSLDEAEEWFSENGFTENIDYDYENSNYLFLDVNNPRTDLNKYTSIKVSDTLGYVVGIIEADEVNLFGEKPIMSYSVCGYNSDIFMAYGNRMYLDGKNTWEAELR